jgi:hypothetical protein
LLAQLYVGEAAVSKGIRSIIRRLKFLPLGPIKTDPGNRVRKPRRGCNRIADFPAKCSNLVRPRNLDALRMVHIRITNFQKLAAQFVLDRIAPASLASARHRPRVDRLRSFHCVRAGRPGGRLHCISAAWRYFCCRVGQGE